jgi:hypothetical protein
MVAARISRRDFLKLMGSGAVVFAVGAFGLSNYSRNARNDARAQSAGSWSSAASTVDVGIHASLLAGGKVYYMAGSGFHVSQRNGPYRHAVWDPATNSNNELPTLDEDLFCVGMSTLPNGNTLMTGGTLAYDIDAFGKFLGLKSAYEVEFSSGSVNKVGSMAHGRWYPTQVALADGKTFVVLGWDEYGCRNQLVEIYDPGGQSFSKQFDPGTSRTYCAGECVVGEDSDQDGQVDFPDAGTACYGGSGSGVAPSMTLYPRMHLMPNGLIFTLGQGSPDWICNPSTGNWFSAGATTPRFYGTTVLCPLQNSSAEDGKVLIAGGSPTPDAPTTNSCEIAEPSGATGRSRRSVASMSNARKHMSPVILPTGHIVLFGGNQQGNIDATAVLTPEQFDPESETWTSLPNASVPRLYHSVALLLHDGRVWNAGSTTANAPKEVRVEIFSPWYVSEARPTISGNPTGGAYGETISIPTPDAADITKVSLVRVSSITHHYNTDQRLIWLQVNGNSGSTVTVSAPINSTLAPPGMYLIHILNSSGVPSVGKFIQIPGSSGPPPPTLESIYAVTGTNNYLQLFTGSLKRAGEMITPASVLKGESVKQVDVILKKEGSPTGTITVVARRGSDDNVSVTFGTIPASSLTDSDQTFSLTAPASHTFGDNDKVLVEWDGSGSSADKVLVKRRFSSDPSSGFDGSNTKQAHYTTSYSSHVGSDLAGEWFKDNSAPPPPTETTIYQVSPSNS